MTEYRTIHVDKRNFTVLVDTQNLSLTAHAVVNADDTRIARNGDTRIARNGDTRVAHNTTSAYPRQIEGVKKRNFTILVDKVDNG